MGQKGRKLEIEVLISGGNVEGVKFGTMILIPGTGEIISYHESYFKKILYWIDCTQSIISTVRE